MFCFSMTRVFPILLITALFQPASAHADEHLLRWKLNDGDRFSVTLVKDTKKVLNDGGDKKEIPILTRIFMTWEIATVKDDMVASNLTIDRVQIEETFKDGNVGKWDSSDRVHNDTVTRVVQQSIEEGLGKPIPLIMTTRGEIKSLQLPGKFRTSGSAGGLVGETLGTDSILRSLELMFVQLPEQAVKVGDRWTVQHRDTVKDIGTITTDVTAMLKTDDPMDESELVAKYAMTFRPPPNAGTVTVDDVTGGAAAWMFDRSAGRLKAAAQKATLSFHGRDGTKQMAISLTETITLKIVPLN